jgi:hypothetical protein
LALFVASLSLAGHTLASKVPTPVLSKRCTFVDDGFVAKDCGNALTADGLTQFFATQASQVAQLQATNPCGFTTCPKMKRDTELTYSGGDVEKRQANMLSDTVPVTGDASGNLAPFNGGAAPKRDLEERQDVASGSQGKIARAVEAGQNMLADLVPVTSDAQGNLSPFNGGATSKRDEEAVKFGGVATSKRAVEAGQNMLADLVPVTSDAQGNLSPFNGGATSKRDEEAVEVLDTRSLSHEELLARGIDLDEDELLARNLPTMRTADGRLVLFGSRSASVPEPVKRDQIDELHERIRRGEVEADPQPVARDTIEERDLVDENDEDELIRRNVAVGRDANGNLYRFGTRSPAPPARE